jgi:hypothetical protein
MNTETKDSCRKLLKHTTFIQQKSYRWKKRNKRERERKKEKEKNG